MRTAYLFHDDTCCLTDCLVRACTCGVAPVPGPEVPNEGTAEAVAQELVGCIRDDGASVDWLSPRVDEENGTLLFHFITSRNGEAEDED